MFYYQVIVLLPGAKEWEPITGFDINTGRVVWDAGARLSQEEAATLRNNLAAENPQCSFKSDRVNGQ